MDKVNGFEVNGYAEVSDTGMDNADKMKGFEEVCKPVIEFLNRHYDPHCTAVITEGYARIVRDEIGVPLPVRD